MKNLIFLVLVVLSSNLFSQVDINPSTGRVNHIKTDFIFNITDDEYSRSLIESKWLSGIGDYISLKHGGSNTEADTYGLRISDGRGFEFGKNNFGTSFLNINKIGNVGIGTTNPKEKLHVIGNIASTGYILTRNPNNLGATVNLSWQNNIARIRVGGNNVGASNGFQFQGPSDKNLLRLMGNGNVGIGTTTPDAKLAVNGKIHTKEVKVDLSGWADYVFKEDYKLPTLQQVEDHINQNGHLINIPSATEVAENGILLGDMNAKLLEKIEELTLYTIAQEKEIEKLQKVKAKNRELEVRLARIEELLK